MNGTVTGIFVVTGLAGNMAGVRRTPAVKPDQLRASIAALAIVTGGLLAGYRASCASAANTVADSVT